MSDQPTAEWTVEGVAIWNDTQPIGVARSGMEAKQIADAHSAAIAAERENLMKLERDWHKVVNEVLKCHPIPARDRTDDQLEPPWEVIARIRHQLAAERRSHEMWEETAKKLDKQLADEREINETLTHALHSADAENKQLREQLAKTAGSG